MRRWIAFCVLTLALCATSVQGQSRGYIIVQPSQVSGIAATTLTRNQILLSPAGYTSVEFLIRFTAAGTATGTLQIWIEDSCDGGTTWDDLVSSNTFAFGASLTTQRFWVNGYVVPSTIGTATLTNLTQGSAAAVETMTAASARQGPFCDRLRVREKVTSPSGTPAGATYVITGVFR